MIWKKRMGPYLIYEGFLKLKGVLCFGFIFSSPPCEMAFKEEPAFFIRRVG